MKAKILGLGLLGLSLMASQASAVVISKSSGDLSASAEFTVSGNTLTVVLTNTSSVAVSVPADVLTAVFFDFGGTPSSLTTVSALLTSGSTVIGGADGGGNVGGEWAYASGLSGAPGGASMGISSAGFGLFGDANFNGANLDDPLAVNGLNYGIVSAGGIAGDANTGVTGVPTIQNSVTFTLTGTGLDLANLGNVSFQYGTALDEPNLPEPGILGLVALGLLGVAYGRRRALSGKPKASV